MISPLSGVRVLDLSQMLAGPFGSMILGDLGAEVIKIEKPDGGDIGTGDAAPFFPRGERLFHQHQSQQKIHDLRPEDQEGLDIFYRLVKLRDVVYDNFRPGILEKLRIDYETLEKNQPPHHFLFGFRLRSDRSIQGPARI